MSHSSLRHAPPHPVRPRRERDRSQVHGVRSDCGKPSRGLHPTDRQSLARARSAIATRSAPLRRPILHMRNHLISDNRICRSGHQVHGPVRGCASHPVQPPSEVENGPPAKPRFGLQGSSPSNQSIRQTFAITHQGDLALMTQPSHPTLSPSGSDSTTTLVERAVGQAQKALASLDRLTRP